MNIKEAKQKIAKLERQVKTREDMFAEQQQATIKLSRKLAAIHRISRPYQSKSGLQGKEHGHP